LRRPDVSSFISGGTLPHGSGGVVDVAAYVVVTMGVFGLLGVVQKLVERL
jgi:hypothetical protein